MPMQGKARDDFRLDGYRKYPISEWLRSHATEADGKATELHTKAASRDTGEAYSLFPGSNRLGALRILIADDHEVARQGIRSLLESHAGWEICAEAKDGREAVEAATKQNPDILLP